MIERLTPAHLPECARLYVETFNAPPWNEAWREEDATQRLKDYLDTPRSHGVGLTSPDGTMLGLALGHRERFGPVDHFLLKELCIHPDHQRQGHGTTLMNALESQLPDIHHWHLVTARNSEAATFYQKLNFRPAARMAVFVRTPQ